MNIELTQEQVAAFNRGESITITPKPKQWEPRKDLCYRSSAFSTRDTLEADNKAHKDMRNYNRLLAYVDEFDGDWVADWSNIGQEKCYIYQSSIDNYWYRISARTTNISGAVYMSKECAICLVDKLESGEVVL